MPIKSLIIATFLILIIPKHVVFAENATTPSASIKYEEVNPGSPYYIFKRLKETITLKFLTQGDKNKAKYTEKLFDTRFRELVYAVETGKTGYLENVASRYTNQAGTIIEKYLKINPNFKPQAQKYIPTLENLRDVFPANSAWWLMIQAAIDTTKRIAGS